MARTPAKWADPKIAQRNILQVRILDGLTACVLGWLRDDRSILKRGLHPRGLGCAELKRSGVGPADLPHTRNYIVSCPRNRACGCPVAVCLFALFKPDPNRVRAACGDIGCLRFPADERLWKTLLDPNRHEFFHLDGGADGGDLLR